VDRISQGAIVAGDSFLFCSDLDAMPYPSNIDQVSCGSATGRGKKSIKQFDLNSDIITVVLENFADNSAWYQRCAGSCLPVRLK